MTSLTTTPFPYLFLIVLTVAPSLTAGGSFKLLLKPKDIEMFYTENVQLECNGHDYSNTTGEMVSVSQIRIAKMDGDGVWKNIAMLLKNNQKTVLDPNASGCGELGKPYAAYLRLTWPLAHESIKGKYKCDVVGLDADGNFKHEMTEPVGIQDTQKTISGVLEALERQRTKSKLKFDQVKKQLLEMSQRTNRVEADKIQEHFSDQDQRLEKIESKLDELLSLYKLDKPVCELQDNFTTDFEADIWPFGYFGLLMPEAGCPEHTMHKWYAGTRQHLTKGKNKIPSNSHMAKPVIKGHFFYQRFCIINNTLSTRAWPRGSYCVNRKKGYCPGGFNPGFMRYDDKQSGSARSGVLPDGYYSSYTRIYYCCRSDGPPTSPIVLPTYQPFYLYRYLGRCQEVIGMKVTKEWFVIDTARDDNGDSYNSKMHPDGKLDPVRVELCYYEAESSSDS